MSSTAPIDQTTFNLYQKGEIDAARNNDPFWGMATQKASVEQGSGPAITWTALASNLDNEEAGAYDDISAGYTPKNLNVQANTTWGRLRNQRALPGWAMQLSNSPSVEMVSWKKKNIPEQLRAMLTQGSKSISYQFLNNDGETNSSGAELPMMGLPSIFRRAGTVANTAQEAVVSTSAEYAGLNLGKDSLTGLDATADSYAWTPRLINTNYDWAKAGSAQADFDSTNAGAIIDYTELAVSFGESQEMRPDCVFVDKVYFSAFRDWIGGKQGIYIDKADMGDKKWGIGSNAFELSHNGLPIYWSYNMPASTGYMLNFDKIKINYLDPRMLEPGNDQYKGDMSGKGEFNDQRILSTICQYNQDRLAWNSACVFGGQIQFLSPKYQARFRIETA